MDRSEIERSEEAITIDKGNKKFDNYIRKKKDKTTVKDQIRDFPESTLEVMKQLGYDNVQI